MNFAASPQPLLPAWGATLAEFTLSRPLLRLRRGRRLNTLLGDGG